MLQQLLLDEQVNKRVQRLLEHYAQSESISPQGARLVINLIHDQAKLHLYEAQRFVKTVDLKEISDFFGTEYDETRILKVQDYLNKLANENNLEPKVVNIVICEVKNQLGAHLYQDIKYIKRISSFELLTHFYFSA